MAIKLLYNDLRIHPAQYQRLIVDWHGGLTAQEAVQNALGSSLGAQVVQDLEHNNREIMVSWVHDELDQGSDVGGVASLDWEILDRSILVITYKNETTTDAAIDASTAWMLADEQQPW